MTEKGYLAAIDFFTARPRLLKAAVITQKACEIMIYIIYPALLLYLFVHGNDLWWRSAIVCGISFIVVSLLRIRWNFQRPYEKFGFAPLIKKESKGRSFPSRHAFSAAIIALHSGIVCPLVGIVTGIATLVIAFLRVVLGVHFIKDVVFGILCGLALGAIVIM